MSEQALYVDGLTVTFGDFKAIDDLSLMLDFGEIHAIIGPNGAGKTTLLDVVTGKSKPREGRVELAGAGDLLSKNESEIALAGVGRKFQKPSIFEALTVRDNLRLATRSRAHSIIQEILRRLGPMEERRIDDVLQTIGMADAEDRPAGQLSHGQKQWLEIGMLLIQEPKVLLLDEPVAGMSDDETERTAALVKALRGPERALVVVEHDMAFVEEIADVVTVLHEGRLLVQGAMDKVKTDLRVVEVYLGR
ncbi:MAG: urea ABC transporter ATP-binding protein UrtD [Pseudomonadota bacterium]